MSGSLRVKASLPKKPGPTKKQNSPPAACKFYRPKTTEAMYPHYFHSCGYRMAPCLGPSRVLHDVCWPSPVGIAEL